MKPSLLPPPLSECNFDDCLIGSSPYRYRPNSVASGIFVTIFTVSLIGCLITAATTSRGRWLNFTVPVCVACVLEIIGYAARLGSWQNPWDVQFFAISTGFLTVAPAFASAGIYTTISQAVPVIGTEHSLISPVYYSKLLFADLLGFVLQVIGLIVAFSDASLSAGLGSLAETGSGLIAAGLAAQLLSLSAFIVLFAAVLARASLTARDFGLTTFHAHRVGGSRRGRRGGGEGRDSRGGRRPNSYVPLGPKFKAFVAIVPVSLICLLARNLYVVMAMSGGLGGPVAGDESLFLGFDGLMVAQAVVGVIIVHPGRFLDERMPKQGGTGWPGMAWWQRHHGNRSPVSGNDSNTRSNTHRMRDWTYG